MSGAAVVYLLEMELTQNGQASTAALLVDGGLAHVERSAIVGNNGGGIRAQGGATLSVVNSFVGGNPVDSPAIDSNQSSIEVVYSTLGLGFNPGSAVLQCTNPVATTVRNSLLVSYTSGAIVTVTDCDVVNTAIETTNDPSEWFGGDFGSGDYRLTGPQASDFQTVAQWQTGDPTTDIDGTPRPSSDGDSDYAGADIP